MFVITEITGTRIAIGSGIFLNKFKPIGLVTLVNKTLLRGSPVKNQCMHSVQN